MQNSRKEGKLENVTVEGWGKMQNYVGQGIDSQTENREEQWSLGVFENKNRASKEAEPHSIPSAKTSIDK